MASGPLRVRLDTNKGRAFLLRGNGEAHKMARFIEISDKEGPLHLNPEQICLILELKGGKKIEVKMSGGQQYDVTGEEECRKFLKELKLK